MQVSSVVTMSEEQLGKIKDTIAKKYGNNFFVETKLDPSILGGLVLFVKNQVIDDSLASKIKKIEKNVRGTT